MNFLLFDDDCGICTKMARIFSRLTTLRMIPMHHESIMTRGIKAIGEEEYWQSFHVLEGNSWSTNSTAIVRLFKYFPFGQVWHRIVQTPPVLWILSNILENFKRRRKMECKINVGDN